MLVNEINTIPGMTAVSMAPAMYMKTFGKTYSDFLDELIELAGAIETAVIPGIVLISFTSIFLSLSLTKISTLAKPLQCVTA